MKGVLQIPYPCCVRQTQTTLHLALILYHSVPFPYRRGPCGGRPHAVRPIRSDASTTRADEANGFSRPKKGLSTRRLVVL